MISIALVEDLTTELDQATQQQDWPQILQMNPLISQLLISLGGASLSAPQLLAIDQLEAAYRRAYQCCGLQKQQFKAEIQNMRNRQPGITAYATMAIAAYEDMAQQEGAR
ncbi:hypothetical protein ACVST5_13885 [Yersinia enterocolitica]|uniref:hypothetical protein n=1 Tax=Yersinia enterocolitica TaxID=630 RepID=UPI001CA52D47|nr:hypothetical protein [Yersinia enterocolitica]MBW5833574.1 hypothetical protein [Yersinia enterocolitica]